MKKITPSYLRHTFIVLFILYRFSGLSDPINILSPSNGTVGQFEKIEFGIELPVSPIDYQQKINDFFGNNGYGSAFDPSNGNINPYDPDQISVEATFTKGSISEKIYGFYYREYSYSIGPAVPTGTITTWVENQTLQHHWRVRFAPKETGTWQVTLVVKVNGIVVFTDNVGKTFYCVDSPNKGFVKFGPNGKYFVGSKNNESIFPIGLNVAYPEVEQIVGFDNTRHYPSRYYNHRERVKKVTTGGGNLARVFTTPYSYKVEWEHLNIYDAKQSDPLDASNTLGVNRQAIMWELDNLLDAAHQYNIYLQLLLEDTEGFSQNPTDNYKWANNPYNQILNSTYGESFFSAQPGSPAFETYKKRLRYIIARWGYSTNISSFEMLNEVHMFANVLDPSSTTAQRDNMFTSWHQNVLQYVKSPGGLNHTDHLFNSCFEDWNGLDILGSAPVDFISRHVYNASNSLLANQSLSIDFYRNKYSRPCQIGEIGVGTYDNCFIGPNPLDGKLDWVFPTFHSLIWSGCMTGSPTSSLEMWERGIDQNQNRPAGQEGYLQHFQPVASFFAGENLDAEKYVPKQVTSNNLEAFVLVNNNADSFPLANKALGYVRNKTFWWYQFTNPSSTYYDQDLSNYYTSATNTCTPNDGYPIGNSTEALVTGQLGTITIPNLVPNILYGIEWYHTMLDSKTTFAILRTDFAYSNSAGQLVIAPPPMMGSTTQDYAFKIRKYVGDACALPHSDMETLVQANGSGYKEITLNNRCLTTSLNGVLRTINLSNNSDVWVNNGIDFFQGWMDPNDRLFFGDMNNDGKEEAIFVNKSMLDGFVMAVNPKTRQLLTWLNHDGTYVGWLDSNDKMFLNDVNYDGRADLVLVNTDYNSGAIRVVDLTTGNDLSWVNHGAFMGFMDPNDRMFIATIQKPGRNGIMVGYKALVLVNTDFSGNAVKVVDLMTGNSLCDIQQGLFNGWMDPDDKMFIGDADNDTDEELIFVNAGYQFGAIMALDLNNPTPTFTRWVTHGSPAFTGLNDFTDKILVEDVNGDNKKDVIFINNINNYTANTIYPNGLIRAFDLMNNTTLFTANSVPASGLFDCNDRVLIGNVLGNGNKDIVLVNAEYGPGVPSFGIYNVATQTFTTKANSLYATGLTGWKDGSDKNTVCHMEVSGSERIAAPGRPDPSLPENELSSIMVYPNPASDQLIIDIDKATCSDFSIDLVDETGRLLYSASNEKKIDVKNIPDGFYILKLKSGNFVKPFKIIIHH